MAFSNLEKAMAAVIGLDIARPGFSRAAAKQAVSVIGRATLGAGRVAAPLAPTVSQIGAAPVGLGVATGLGILGTPEGQAALAAAEALADSGSRAAAIRNAMLSYGFFSDEEIEDTIASAGYRDGGRVGFRFGGIDEAIESVQEETIEK